MNKAKRGKDNAYSLTITNGLSCAKELAATLLPGDDVNIAVIHRKVVKCSMAKPALKVHKKEMGK